MTGRELAVLGGRGGREPQLGKFSVWDPFLLNRVLAGWSRKRKFSPQTPTSCSIISGLTPFYD